MPHELIRRSTGLCIMPSIEICAIENSTEHKENNINPLSQAICMQYLTASIQVSNELDLSNDLDRYNNALIACIHDYETTNNRNFGASIVNMIIKDGIHRQQLDDFEFDLKTNRSMSIINNAVINASIQTNILLAMTTQTSVKDTISTITLTNSRITTMRTTTSDCSITVISIRIVLIAIAAALCVQRGLLNYSALVTRYWPEYGQKGKENTTVADILSHRAGVPDVSISSFDQYRNWTTMIDLLEQERPVWIPGHAQGYHALTYGWLVGEIVRRVDPQKRTIGEFIRDEIADRIQTEFYIGLPQEFEQRVSPLIFTDVEGILNGSMLTLYNFYNEAGTHQAEIPAANGITNARSLARIFASLIANIDNRKESRLLQAEILQHATTSNTLPNEIDLILQIPFPFGMGFMLYEHDFPMFGQKSFGHS
ncbi:unnamed protein product, partial [Rotaria sp. Silwood2]